MPSIPQVAGIKNENIFISVGMDSLGQISPGINMNIIEVTTIINNADSLILKQYASVCEKKQAAYNIRIKIPISGSGL